MGSGKYSALSGALAREQAMSNLANNLANVNSTGFKKNTLSFESLLRGVKQNTDAHGINHTRIRTIGTDFSQGGLQTTDRPLDVAIDGPGFFKVRRGQDIFYTRSGHLMLDANGTIKTEDGLEVLGAGNEPLQIDTAEGGAIGISEYGDISLDGVLTGVRLQVFSVPDPGLLIKSGHSLYRLDQPGDQPQESFRLVQGSLEGSNVNMVEEMTAMISAQRSFEAHTKVIESYSKISAKQDELGTIG
ncbi:MAG: flagellar basal-body rod protein FlgF [Desulfobulbus sp.]|jgi:flagellar basal-body rod protein FlgF